MFESELNDVMGDSSTPIEDINTLETTDNTAVEPNSDTQSNGQADIQDGSASEQTVPYDRFSEINERLKNAEAREQQLIALLSRGQTTQTQQEQEIDIVDKIVGEDLFVTKDQMREILRAEKQRTEQNYNNVTQSSKKAILNQTEAVFRQSAPDYDAVIKNISPKMVQTLYDTYDNPSELVEVAYKIGKSLAPQKPTAASVVKQAGISSQPQPKAVTANQIKGGSVGGKTAQQLADELWKEL